MADIDIAHLSRLAQLALDDGERVRVLEDLERIIAMVDQMQGIDTDGVAPLAHPLDAGATLKILSKCLYRRNEPQIIQHTRAQISGNTPRFGDRSTQPIQPPVQRTLELCVGA